MIKHRHSRDFRFIRTSERKKKPETIIDSADMSAAAGTHPVPTVACGVLIVCVEHTSSWPQVLFCLVTGSSQSDAHSFILLLQKNRHICRGCFPFLFRIPDTAWPHAFFIFSPKPVHMTACVRVFECMVVTAGAFLVWLTSTPPLLPVRTILSFWFFEIIILYLSHVISDSMLNLSSFAHVGRRL